jgi:hypothetical protein
MKVNMKKERKKGNIAFFIMFLISLNQYAQDSVIDTWITLIKSLSDWLAPILAHCGIAFITNCGHAPVNLETKRIIRLEKIIPN